MDREEIFSELAEFLASVEMALKDDGDERTRDVLKGIGELYKVLGCKVERVRPGGAAFIGWEEEVRA